MLIILFFALIGCSDEYERVSIIGNWTCNEVTEFGSNTTFSVNITANYYKPNDSNSYIIMNFHNIGSDSGNEIIADEVEPGVLLIKESPQHISFTGGGVIAINFEAITWQYQVNDGVKNPQANARFY